MIWLLGAIFMLMVNGACVHRYCGGEGPGSSCYCFPLEFSFSQTAIITLGSSSLIIMNMFGETYRLV